MNKRYTSTVIIAIIVVILLLSQSIYTVDQRKYAIKFQFGEIVALEDKPGLKFKIPFIQNVRFYDKRNMTLINSEADSIMTSEKKPLLIDFVVLWRIADVGKFYTSFSGDEDNARLRLRQTVRSKLMEEITRRTIHDVISQQRDQIMSETRDKTSKEMAPTGIQVVDIRLRRVDFPTDVTNSVYDRMQAERSRVANELRATGNANKAKIEADANRQHQVILADAYRQAQEIKGKGDAEAAAIYAKAYGVDPDFYNFYRSLDAYKASLTNKDILVLDPSSEFFKYFKSYGGKK
jgi:membrane protease subunit HflC